MNNTYQCTQCKKSILINSNIRGVDFTNHCVITPLCSGQLVNASATATQSSAIRRTPRNVLFIFKQQLSESVWKVAHNLNSNPSIQVYVDTVIDGKSVKKLMLPDEYVVTYNTPNSVTIEFATQVTGEVHLISRSSNPVTADSTDSTTSYESISTNGIITIAVIVRDEPLTSLPLTITTISPSIGTAAIIEIELNPHKLGSNISLFDTPWQSTDTITVNGQLFKLYSGRISDTITQNSIEPGSPFSLHIPDHGIILLTKPPYETDVDVDVNNTISIDTIVINEIAPTSVTSSNGFLVDSTLLSTYHPPIKTITTIF